MGADDRICGACGLADCACSPPIATHRPFQLLERVTCPATAVPAEPPPSLIREYKGPTVADFERRGAGQEWLAAPGPDSAAAADRDSGARTQRSAATMTDRGGRVLAGPGSRVALRFGDRSRVWIGLALIGLGALAWLLA